MKQATLKKNGPLDKLNELVKIFRIICFDFHALRNYPWQTITEHFSKSSALKGKRIENI